MMNVHQEVHRNRVKYEKAYSEEKFEKKIQELPASAGCQVLKTAVTLYVILTEGKVPLWAKTSIILALGYFISPIDLIPDIIFPIGYLDDLAVMTAVLAKLHSFRDNRTVQEKVELLLPALCLGKAEIAKQ
ncbi:YkvA family protein [Desulfobotulus mexicanus]|uniref:DUF1232 domain-containing protein n=1 Tax=Desulfobotulus mexicanus TaxID=2586642 RepID=A0A5S5MBR3_9BACT|nr:YkvA family protein [Desulfobotulus mexicanus]TYT73154.1 DUF1232 domain-containing protein [Desulfobotulus mexicanus]